MSNVRQLIHNWLLAHRDAGTCLLQQLVRCPSKAGAEAAAQQLIATHLQSLQLEVEIWEPDGTQLAEHEYFYSPRQSFTGSPNIVAKMKGTGNGRSILLNGHIDVVPEGNVDDWRHDPFGGIKEEGKLYGRGASDMKGGTVSLLLALQAIKELGISLQGDVIFQSVIEEESGGAGTLAAIVKGYKADAALIPEPTNLRIFTKQQGSMWFRITVTGRAAHGGTRYEGVSAIEKSMLVVQGLQGLEHHRNSRITDPLYADNPIPVPINVGIIQGGNWPSSVPDTVVLEGRMGVAPYESLDDAKREMVEWIGEMAKHDAWLLEHPPKVEWFGARWIPGDVDPDHEFARVLRNEYYATVGHEPKVEASPWGTDGGLLTKLADTPCIVFGPGVTEAAHYPNEYIVLDDVFTAAEVVAMTLIQWCGMEVIQDETDTHDTYQPQD
ncbi:peptidase [Paenibacillus taiwanensis]|uniref:peptidase n=1 Tax=Paenibacillus taiwanensis TaxID=401638 RepID=UPI000491476D